MNNLFLSNISVVDHAFVNEHGHIVGGSYNPSFIVSGKVEEKEQVVVDFSNIKRRIKQLIDHRETGFDHKLWVIDGYSHCTVTPSRDDHDVLLIVSPVFELMVPKNAVRHVTIADGYVSPLADQSVARMTVEQRHDYEMGQAFAQYVQRGLREEGLNVTIQCNNNTDKHLYVPASHALPASFRYTHGLKNSSSWGCQNIAHGHKSFIQIVSSGDQNAADRLAQQMATELTHTMFIWEENVESIQTVNKARQVIIGYTTERGRFSLRYTEGPNNRVCITLKETTIENLVGYIYGLYHDELHAVHAEQLYVSEGLSKGAVFNLREEN